MNTLVCKVFVTSLDPECLHSLHTRKDNPCNITQILAPVCLCDVVGGSDMLTMGMCSAKGT